MLAYVGAKQEDRYIVFTQDRSFKEYSKEELKHKIKNGEIECGNYRLSVDNKLIESLPSDLERIKKFNNFFEYVYESFKKSILGETQANKNCKYRPNLSVEIRDFSFNPNWIEKGIFLDKRILCSDKKSNKEYLIQVLYTFYGVSIRSLTENTLFRELNPNDSKLLNDSFETISDYILRKMEWDKFEYFKITFKGFHKGGALSVKCKPDSMIIEADRVQLKRFMNEIKDFEGTRLKGHKMGENAFDCYIDWRFTNIAMLAVLFRAYKNIECVDISSQVKEKSYKRYPKEFEKFLNYEEIEFTKNGWLYLKKDEY